MLAPVLLPEVARKRARDEDFAAHTRAQFPAYLAHSFATGCLTVAAAERAFLNEYKRARKAAKTDERARQQQRVAERERQERAREHHDAMQQEIERVVLSGLPPSDAAISKIINHLLNPKPDFKEAARFLAYCIGRGAAPFRRTSIGGAVDDGAAQEFLRSEVFGWRKEIRDECAELLPMLYELTPERVQLYLESPHRALFLKFPRVWFYAAQDPAAMRAWAANLDLQVDLTPELAALCHTLQDIPGADEYFLRI